MIEVAVEVEVLMELEGALRSRDSRSGMQLTLVKRLVSLDDRRDN